MLIFLLCLITMADARISVMYAHEKSTDLVANECLHEMYSKTQHLQLQETDEACIIFCVLKKFGIMSPNGGIDVEVYKRRVQLTHNLDRRLKVTDTGTSCFEAASSGQHNQDVCKKAKIFNDCTHLYRILLK